MITLSVLQGLTANRPEPPVREHSAYAVAFSGAFRQGLQRSRRPSHMQTQTRLLTRNLSETLNEGERDLGGQRASLLLFCRAEASAGRVTWAPGQMAFVGYCSGISILLSGYQISNRILNFHVYCRHRVRSNARPVPPASATYPSIQHPRPQAIIDYRHITPVAPPRVQLKTALAHF